MIVSDINVARCGQIDEPPAEENMVPRRLPSSGQPNTSSPLDSSAVGALGIHNKSYMQNSHSGVAPTQLRDTGLYHMPAAASAALPMQSVISMEETGPYSRGVDKSEYLNR